MLFFVILIFNICNPRFTPRNSFQHYNKYSKMKWQYSAIFLGNSFFWDLTQRILTNFFKLFIYVFAWTMTPNVLLLSIFLFWKHQNATFSVQDLIYCSKLKAKSRCDKCGNKFTTKSGLSFPVGQVHERTCIFCCIWIVTTFANKYLSFRRRKKFLTQSNLFLHLVYFISNIYKQRFFWLVTFSKNISNGTSLHQISKQLISNNKLLSFFKKWLI